MNVTTTTLGFQKLAGFFYSGLGATYTTTVTAGTGEIKSFNVLKRPLSGSAAGSVGVGGGSGTVVYTEDADVEFELEVWGQVTRVGTFVITSVPTGGRQGSALASYATDANGNVTGLVGSDGNAIYYTKDKKNYVTQNRTVIYSAQNGTASGVVYKDGGGAFIGNMSVDNNIYRTGKQSLKFYASTNGSTLEFSPPTPSITVASMGTIGLWIYLERTSSTTIVLKLSKDTTGTITNHRSFSFSNDILKAGWNCLTINVNEDGTTGPTTDGHSWTTGGSMLLTDVVNYISVYISTIQNQVNPIYIDSIYYGQQAKAKVMIGFDDGADTSKVTYALPAMSAYGFKGYLGANVDATGTYTINAGGSYKVTKTGTFDTAIAPLYAAGWDVIPQGIGHIDYSANTTNTGLLTSHVDAGMAVLDSLGIPRGRNMFAYPVGGSNTSTNAILIAKGIKLARSSRRKNVPTTEFGVDQLINIGSQEISNQTLTYVKQRIDSAILYGETINIFGHQLIAGGDGVSTTGNSLQFYANDFISLMQYIYTKVQAGLIDVVTPTEWLADIDDDFNLITPSPVVAFTQTTTPTPILTGIANRQISGLLNADITIQAPITEGVRVGDKAIFNFKRAAALGATTSNITWNAAFSFHTAFANPTATVDDGKSTSVEFTWNGTVFRQTSVVNSWV